MFFDMTYEQAIAFLNSRISIGWKLGLDSMRQMLTELGNPQHKCRFVHIAGTNGKGSVAALLHAIFQAAGYTSGLYTSPHLVDVRERIRLNEAKIPQQAFADLTGSVRPIIVKYNATYFETVTVLAFLYFAESKTDIVCLEVGLGGRLDATNVVDPELSIITSISFDHTEHLGKTLPDIAREKAGIIKRDRACLIGDVPRNIFKIIKDIARTHDATVYDVNALYHYTILNERLGRTTFKLHRAEAGSSQYTLNMNGEVQVGNACLAIAACDLLSREGWICNDQAIAAGLLNVNWPGRFQVVQRTPLIIFDVAHNVAAINQLVRTMARLCANSDIIFVIGLLKDKDGDRIIQRLAQVASMIQPVVPAIDRALPAQELQAILMHHDIKFFPACSVSEGIQNVLPILKRNAALCVTGSHYVVGEAMETIKGLTK
ncbi:bifunctional folylpolyglutamate synthase/dihydrofolate synthase [candidate division KSB1 bacterium]|nr:bifunctional folylpolyglutamate synthase/dihydrofolate synthase [candidate division KSB1 bacterium]RQW05137.1 MAG: bifunctional folylpolyglutamate synthase/dihydrofolate synthase [candidate division KSB1 bacterium]